jgi:hypothetical protein
MRRLVAFAALFLTFALSAPVSAMEIVLDRHSPSATHSLVQAALSVATDVLPLQNFVPGIGGPVHQAIVPEPNSGLLVIAGLLGLAGWRKARSA